jgi:hypothetical protein
MTHLTKSRATTDCDIAKRCAQAIRLFILALILSSGSSGCGYGLMVTRGGLPTGTADPLYSVVSVASQEKPNMLNSVFPIAGTRETARLASIDVGELGILCSLLDEKGNPLPIKEMVGVDPDRFPIRTEFECEGEFAHVPTGHHRMIFTATCQPQGVVDVDVPLGGVAVIPLQNIPMPAPERLYVRPMSKVINIKEFSATNTRLPPNTLVEVVRILPNRSGNCSRALATVVDSGGQAIDADALIIDKEDLSTTAYEGVSAQAYVAQQKEAHRLEEEARRVGETRRAEVAARAATIAAADEVASGRCSQDHYDTLQRAIQWSKFVFSTMNNGNEVFSEVGHEVLVATPKGRKFSLQIGAGGELHLLAISFAQVSLDAIDHSGYSSTASSSYGRIVWGRFDLGGHDSRVIQANNGEHVAVEVRGSTCTTVIAILKQ